MKGQKTIGKEYLSDLHTVLPLTPTSALFINTGNSTDDKYVFSLNKYIKVLIRKSPLKC